MTTGAMFSPYLGTKFLVRAFSDQHIERVFEFELVEVSELPPTSTNSKHNLRQDPFTLLFKCSQDVLIEQGTYTFEHQQCGSTELFMVPVGVGEYEVIFS